MARYGGDYGWGRGYDSYFRGQGRGYDRGYRGEPPYERPWTGAYRPGFQGGSSGIPNRSSGRRYGGDYWWLGEREMIRNSPPTHYDEAYRRFNAESHPRYSPVGGNYPAMGGSYAYGRPPRPLREETWFSDWTRWF